jgi:hypothetical protein
MMTVSHTPAPARSDVLVTRVAQHRPARPYLRHGRMLSVGAVAWALSMAVFGGNPQGDVAATVVSIGSGVFQVGLLLFLRALWSSRALGEGGVARAVLRLQAGLVGLAMCSTLADAVHVSDLAQPGWALLDACWPLSMLGMFLIGVRIAIAGRWRGVTRFWPLVAESWVVVVVPTMLVLGETAANIVAPLHLLVGYTFLGLLVARKAD